MSENREIEILRADAEFSRYRTDVSSRADESTALKSALGESIDLYESVASFVSHGDMALIRYMERAQLRAEQGI